MAEWRIARQTVRQVTGDKRQKRKEKRDEQASKNEDVHEMLILKCDRKIPYKRCAMHDQTDTIKLQAAKRNEFRGHSFS